MIAKIASCDRCLQYAEDCACCADCGGTDGDHTRDCDHASTRVFSMVVPRMKKPVRLTLVGLGSDRTIVEPRIVVRVGDALPLEHTTRINVRHLRKKSAG